MSLSQPVPPRKHVLVVGGTKGLGLAVVRLFQQEGHAVSVIARHAPATTEALVRYETADLTDSAATAQALSKIWSASGPPSCVVFCQRYRDQGDKWAGEMATTLTATKQTIDVLVSEFDLQNSAIVLISSINGHLVSSHLPLSYHLAKSSLNHMARYYAVVLGSRGIRVNSISPSSFLKDESKDFVLKDTAKMAVFQKITPLGRLGSAEEVARVAFFLGTSASSFITGQDIIVDGGLSLNYQETLAFNLADSATN